MKNAWFIKKFAHNTCGCVWYNMHIMVQKKMRILHILHNAFLAPQFKIHEEGIT